MPGPQRNEVDFYVEQSGPAGLCLQGFAGPTPHKSLRHIIPHAMPAAIGDVGRDGVDPVEGIEEANGRTGGGIGRCGDLKHAVVGPSDAIGCKRRARHVTREPLKLPGIFRGERLSGENRKPGMRRLSYGRAIEIHLS